MQSTATTPAQYISELPEDRRVAMEKLRKVVSDNIPSGFKEVIEYGMLSYCVPHEIYPNGYHCNPKDPLPFFAMASQKNSINIYHMMVYADKELHDWFVEEFPKHSKARLDMGKSCIRFKKLEDIPYALLGELLTKVTVEQWIERYESNFKK
jgi:Domain of unknown function (DU1801)